MAELRSEGINWVKEGRTRTFERIGYAKFLYQERA
jgi:hypothetical protein